MSAMTRWLDRDEQRVWRSYIEANQLLTDRLARDLDEDSDLSLPEYEVLVRLSEQPDRSLRMSALADKLVHSRSRLTHTAHRMEDRGLVERRACPGDGRGVLCVMTDAGYEALVKAAPVHVEGVRTHLFDQMTPQEVRVLGAIMGKVRDHLRSG
jgi:DNA-binding MarR family transcriptional regulator